MHNIAELTFRVRGLCPAVAEFQQQCEEYLVIIVQQTREADEQQRSVQLRSVIVTARHQTYSALVS